VITGCIQPKPDQYLQAYWYTPKKRVTYIYTDM